MSGPSQIDLGVYHFDPEPEPEERLDPPGWSWPEWRRLRQVAPRRWLAALLVPVLLAAANSAPPRPPLVPLWEVPGQLVASDTTGYGIERVGGVTAVTAYRLADGAVRWHRLLPGPRWFGPDLAGGVLLMDDWSAESLVALDPGTGRVRWRRDGRHLVTVAERWLLFTDPDAGPGQGATDALPGGGGTEITVVDVRTGETAWTGWFGPGEEPLSGVTEYLLTTQRPSRLTRYDPATGAVLAVAGTADPDLVDLDQLGIPVSINWVGPLAATVVADLVVVSDRLHAAAYEVATLRQRWEVELGGDGWLAGCGRLVCDYREATGTLRGLDPATGEIRWSRGCRDASPAGEGYCTLLRPVPAGDRTLLARVTVEDGEETVSALSLNEATGEISAEVTGWSLTGLRQGDRVLMANYRPVAERAAGPRVWLAWWRSDPPAPEVLGPVTADWCGHFTGSHLLCGVIDPGTGEVTGTGVWRVG